MRKPNPVTGNAHAIRAAMVRLAKQWQLQHANPAQGYGCVDWFRYTPHGASADAAASPSDAAGHPPAHAGE